MARRIAELESGLESSDDRRDRSSASGSPSPERPSQDNSTSSRSGRGRGRSGGNSLPRRTETSTGVVGTFDEVSPRDAAESTGEFARGMPPIQEEGGEGKSLLAGPDNDALDAQFQSLMNEINNNLGCVVRPVFLHVLSRQKAVLLRLKKPITLAVMVVYSLNSMIRNSSV
jgi:hypothetical protein